MDYGDYPSGAVAGMSAGIVIVYLAIAILMIAACWKIFTKAGKPGWAAIIPIYNVIVLLEVINKPLWWVILWFIPFVNFIIYIIISIELAKKYGKGGGFAVGLILLPVIFYPILGFGGATYQG
jgi:hypothetical protein